MNASIKTLLLSALLIEPVASHAQSALIQFRFTESTGTSVTNTGSLGGTGTVVGALGSAGVSDLAGDYSFNNTGATGMGSLGTTGGITASVSAMGTAKKSLTLQGWFKSGTVIGNGARLLDNYSVADVKGFALRGPSSGENAGALYFLADGQTVNSGANTYGDTNGWVFFAVTYDYSSGVNSNNVKFYKGTPTSPVVQVGTAQTFGINVQSIDATTTTNLSVGNYANIRPYDGYLDNIRVYGDTTTGAGALTLAQLEVLRQADVANAAKTAGVTVTATTIIRDDIEAKTFGGGVDMRTPQFKDVMTGPYPATKTMFQDMKMGTMRFPQGTSSLFYYWKNPPASYIDHGDATHPDPFPGLTGSMLITPTQMYTYTDKSAPPAASLHMDLLFQVNSFSYVVNNWTVTWINKNKTDGSKQAEIEPANLTGAANYAADWVNDSFVNHSTNVVTYWEVGNEDWVWWTPALYAQIFNEFASKMKAVVPSGSEIRLLAQTTTGSNTGAGGITNTSAWTSQMAGAMTAAQKNNVYALSEHQYLNGNATGTLPNGTPLARDFSNYPASAEGQRALLTENMFAKVQANSRINFLKGEIAAVAPAWKIWMTEFNVVQNDATTTAANPNGIMKRLHDLGHGLVLADWTGKMLESGVERILIHSFDHHPNYSVIDYVNSGGTIAAPIKTVPGYAFGIFPQEFGKKMVQNSVNNNPQLSSPNEGNYNQVSVYSSIRETDNTLRVIVINRSANSGIQITLGCTGRTIAAAPAQYTRRELYSENLLDSNFNAPDTVKWSTPVSVPVPGSVIDGIVLKEHSANLFIIPLVP
jgi:hypothetical protein